MCRASEVASGPGVTPDFDSSPEVLIWRWRLSGPRVSEEVEGCEEESSARPLSSWVAFFWLSTEETRKRLGIVEVRGLHLSRRFVLAKDVFQQLVNLKCHKHIIHH